MHRRVDEQGALDLDDTPHARHRLRRLTCALLDRIEAGGPTIAALVARTRRLADEVLGEERP